MDIDEPAVAPQEDQHHLEKMEVDEDESQAAAEKLKAGLLVAEGYVTSFRVVIILYSRASTNRASIDSILY